MSLSWQEQVAAGKFPTCPEVCEDCQSGKHILHLLDELGDLVAFKESHPLHLEQTVLAIRGSVEDELWLEQMLNIIGRLYPRHQSTLSPADEDDRPYNDCED